jgi:hypothetical protein
MTVWRVEKRTIGAALLGVLAGIAPMGAIANPWSIPLAGNSFRLTPQGANNGVEAPRGVVCRRTEDTFASYFHIDRDARVRLTIEGQSNSEAFQPKINVVRADRILTTRAD